MRLRSSLKTSRISKVILADGFIGKDIIALYEIAFHTDFFDDRLLAGTISLASYGHEVMSDDDELIVQMEKVAQISTTVGTPGQTPVDFFPFRMWLLSFAKHDEILIVFLSSFFPDLAPRCRIS